MDSGILRPAGQPGGPAPAGAGGPPPRRPPFPGAHGPPPPPRRGARRRPPFAAPPLPAGPAPARTRAIPRPPPRRAAGTPCGLDRSVSAGIVSALQREIQAPNSYAIDHVIQTDAAINHGNSGGPLINANGRVIGVNAQIETGSTSGAGGNVGIGFAIPINTVRTGVAQLLTNSSGRHAPRAAPRTSR